MLKRKLSVSGFWAHGVLIVALSHGFDLQTPLTASFNEIQYVAQADKIAALGDTSILQFNSIDSLAAEKKSVSFPSVQLNVHATTFVKSYLKQNNVTLSKVKQKSESIFKLMDSVLQKKGLPVQLKYLAVIESNLKSTAVSRVGAVGTWQLMPSTARLLGLKVTKKYDERKQTYKSTTAAAKYLKDLYNQYGDWLLVIAAYNGGPGTVNRAIKKSGSHNFWKLQYNLPAETRMHVKRFIGTHYYFEGTGSAATLTKAENEEHKKKIADFISSLNPESTDFKVSAR
ncbi:MAG: lytic transglycosylase domain-containing protein [Bacteroidota bacterium]|nr:lytic transglycosylase domain-containing protein [Bacteroidota bacterium]